MPGFERLLKPQAMKIPFLLIAIASTAILTTGCHKERRTTDSAAYTSMGKGGGSMMRTSERIVTSLPTGYRTRVYRGESYYEANNVYYRRSADRRGYTVVPRPW